MEIVKQFLAKYSITTHSVAVVFAFLLGAYLEVPQFHDAVLSAYALLPGWAKQLIVIGWALYSWYRNGQRKWQSGDPERRNNLLSSAQKGGQ